MTVVKNSGLMKTQDLVGKPVISLQGEEVGIVAKVVVDPAHGRVAGLVVNIKGLFKGEKGMEFESVLSFGDYAVTLQRAGQVVPLTNLPTVEKFARDYSIFNMRIITPDGKLIGVIDDFYFNKKTGIIEKYVVSGGVIKNLFKGRASIPTGGIEKIGRDVVIAIDDVEKTMIKEDNGLQDGIEGLKEDLGQLKDDLGQWKDDLGHWKDDFEKVWDKTVTKTLKISRTLGENLKEAAQSGKGKGKKLLAKTSEVLAEKAAQLKDSYEGWMEKLQAVKNRPDKPLTPDEAASLIGLKAGKTVKADDGTTIVIQNRKVTQETVDAAQKAGKVRELLISVATKDLEDKIISVEEAGKQ